jgi:hypothetical protein
MKARPNQRKHLKTATTTFLGLDINFVQLRSKEYGNQVSRIPSSAVSIFFLSVPHLFYLWPGLMRIKADHLFE